MSETNSDSTPASPSPVPALPKKSGAKLGLIALALFAVAAVITWQTGSLDHLIHKLHEDHAAESSGLLNLNTASLEQIEALPSIDEKVAADILEKRPFATLEDVKKVKGIGDKKLEKLRGLVTVE